MREQSRAIKIKFNHFDVRLFPDLSSASRFEPVKVVESESSNSSWKVKVSLIRTDAV